MNIFDRLYTGRPMSASIIRDTILRRFRAKLDETYGGRLDRVVLFGSRARGDAHPDSDYDIAVFIDTPGSFWEEVDRLVDLETELLYETGAVINAIPFRTGAWEDRTSLMQEIRLEGVDF